MVNFVEKIKSLRKQRNLTQKQLADLADVAISVISAYESGNRYPSYEVLINLSHIFHVSIDYLLGISTIKSIDVTGLNDNEIDVIMQMVEILKSNI